MAGFWGNTTPGDTITILSANVRSSQDMRKIYILAKEVETQRRKNTTGNQMATIMAIQETWLRSDKARSEIVCEKGMAGWDIHRLDRARPADHKSGGIAICTNGEGCMVRSRVVDTLGAMRTDVIKEIEREESKETIKTAVINIYVPTGNNKLGAERERVLERRVMGAVRNATEGMENVVVTGDWNHLTNRWCQLMEAMGLKMIGREGVMVMMAKRPAEGSGYCEMVKDILPTDHAAIGGTFHVDRESHKRFKQRTARIDMKVVKQQAEELKKRMTEAIRESSQTPAQDPVNRMRWLMGKMREEAVKITRDAIAESDRLRGKMYFPKKLGMLYDKLRGKVKLEKGETIIKIQRQEEKERRRWKSRQKEKWVEKQRKDYEENVRKVFRRLKGNVYDPMITQTHKGKEYTNPEDIGKLVDNVIGSRWKEEPRRNACNEKWQAYMQPRRGDSLVGIDEVPSKEEIMAAFRRTGKGKATHSDQVSKELIEMMPEEAMQIMVEYIQHVFRTGEVDEEEGDTEVILLIKKLDKDHTDIENKRPISLIKFTTKWWQTVLADRMQNRIKSLSNYGFSKQRGTVQAVRKIIAILEWARLRGIPAHMLTIDIEKAYDTVPYELIEEAMRRHQCPEKIIKLVHEAHAKRSIKIKVRDEFLTPIKPRRGVAQGSPLSCILFVMAMQPLLNRLEKECQGIIGGEDDTMYVDDLTLLTRDAAALRKKWEIVKEFEEFSGMMINVGKCEYDTTEPNQTRWFSQEGVKNMILETSGEAVRILGYLLNTKGERHQQIEKISTSIRVTANMMRRRLMTPDIAKGVVNLILSTRLNYIAQMYELPAVARDTMEKQVNKLVKAQYGYPTATATQKLYTATDDGGDGMEHPGDLADRALIHEYYLALCSEVEKRTAKIMEQNIQRISQLSGGDPMNGGSTAKRAKRFNHHKAECPLAPQKNPKGQKQGSQTQAKKCTCDTVRLADTMHMQCARALARQQLTLNKTNEYEGNIRCGAQERVRLRQSAKKIITEGQLLIAKGKNGEGSFLIQAAGQWGEDERAIMKLQARWYPRLYVKQAQGKGSGWMTIFGDRLPKEPSAEDAEGRYIGPDEIMAQVVQHKWAKRSVVKACLEAQWDTRTEYRKALKIEDIPGVGPNYLWELDTAEWDVISSAQHIQ